jgi:signal transduction histidine kinase
MSGATNGKTSPPAYLGLRSRILAIALVPLSFATLALAIYLSHKSIGQLEQALDRQGRNLVRHLALEASQDLAGDHLIYLKRLIDNERSLHDAEAIGVSGADGGWLLISGNGALLEAPPDARHPMFWRKLDLWYFRQEIRPFEQSAQGAPHTPVGAAPVGHVTAVMNTTRLEDARSEIITATVSLLIVLVGAAGLIAWRLSTRLSRPLAETLRAVSAIASGDLHARVPERSLGELRELEKSINRMAERLETYARDMECGIRVATAKLMEQKQASEAANAAKSRFLAAASHDLRQPLHTLMLLTGALQERLDESDAETRRLTENIQKSAQSMGTLLNALLDLSRLDAGVVVAKPECFPIADLLGNIKQQFNLLAEEKGLRLQVHYSDLTVFSDPTLLERVLANLVSNAIRYTEHGGILVGVRRVQKDWARIEVWDTGIGIPDEYQNRIFEEFFQLDGQEKGYGKGLGLGLAIVLRLVRLLGSSIAVRSIPGKGSCFSVRAVRCELPPGWRKGDKQDRGSFMGRPMVVFIDEIGRAHV